MRRRTSVFSGQVQGVGFRYAALNIASRYAVTGYVRNTPDGQVELVMEGTDTDMDEIVREIGERMNGFVRKRTDHFSPATGEFGNFTIRH